MSDTYAPLAPYFQRSGPAPACSDAEILTIALMSECCGWDRETNLIACWQAHRDLFPCLPSGTRFNRRRRQLQDAFVLLRQAICALLALAQGSLCILDSLPVPVVQFYHAPQARTKWAALGDKGYISAPLAQALHDEHDIILVTVPRANQQRQIPDAVRQQHIGA